MSKIKTFDQACSLNGLNSETNDTIVSETTGIPPVNSAIWLSLLTDLINSLYTWEGTNIEFQDLLLIEHYINSSTDFVIVPLKYTIGKAVIQSQKYSVMRVIVTSWGMREEPTAVRLIEDRLPENIVREYTDKEFVYFEKRFLKTKPLALVMKYSQILGKLDALYMQNLDKLSLPIIATTESSLKNALLNIFKRAEVNALFSISGKKTQRAEDLFYNPQIEFILDKVNTERANIMKELLQELGVNPNDDVATSSHYVNTVAIKESSLISKFFSATTNKLRTDLENRCNEKWGDINLSYHTTIKTYEEETVNEPIL